MFFSFHIEYISRIPLDPHIQTGNLNRLVQKMDLYDNTTILLVGFILLLPTMCSESLSHQIITMPQEALTKTALVAQLPPQVVNRSQLAFQCCRLDSLDAPRMLEFHQLNYS